MFRLEMRGALAVMRRTHGRWPLDLRLGEAEEREQVERLVVQLLGRHLEDSTRKSAPIAYLLKTA